MCDVHVLIADRFVQRDVAEVMVLRVYICINSIGLCRDVNSKHLAASVATSVVTVVEYFVTVPVITSSSCGIE